MGWISDILDLFRFRQEQKKHLENRRIELVQSGLDTTVCNWVHKDQSYFLNQRNLSSDSPIFDFTFFNHYQKPIILREFDVNVRLLPSGLGKPYVEYSPIKPFGKYSFEISPDSEENTIRFRNPIRLSAQEPFRFQVELLYPGRIPLRDRYSVKFDFNFNNKVNVDVPLILLNTDNEKGELKHLILI